MKSVLVGSFIVVCIVIGFPTDLMAQEGRREAPLTNAAVVKLSRAGFKEKTIISIISSRVPQFDLGPDRMIELKRNGVTERIIVAMLERQEGLNLLDDSWGNDGSMDDDRDLKGVRADNGKNSNDGSTDIFGSSGGVKGRSRSRGREGEVAEDTQTTGSATVRILRPPTEAGGASAKLEKTPALTNDVIQEWVEAGFSEGTIIRRIERSPVEFDLRAEKLDELKKHRVSEKIVAAMKAASGEGATK